MIPVAVALVLAIVKHALSHHDSASDIESEAGGSKFSLFCQNVWSPMIKFSQCCIAASLTLTQMVYAVEELQDYTKTSGVAGSLLSVGSRHACRVWQRCGSKNFKHFIRNVDLQVQASGSATAPPALTEGTVNLVQWAGQCAWEKLKPLSALTATNHRTACRDWCHWRFVHRDNRLKDLTSAS